MSERVICKDSDTKISSKTISKICGWNNVVIMVAKMCGDHVSVDIRRGRLSAECPCCGKRSTHVHSHYRRKVADLPLHGLPLRLNVETTRYRCTNKDFAVDTFAAQTEGVTERYSRLSVAARDYLEHCLVSLPATDGATHSASGGLPLSASTALRVVHAIETDVDRSSVRNICIDDFAFKKGQSYRTLIVDADTCTPLEIVGSRDEKDVRRTLKKYKNLEVVSRDRSGAYAKAIETAHPQAIQVADRFHLVKNSGEHVEDAIKHSLGVIRRDLMKEIGESALSASPREYYPPTRRQKDLFDEVHRLRDKGRSARQIASCVGIGRGAVNGILKAEEAHGRKTIVPKNVVRHLDVIEKGMREGESYIDIRSDILAAGGSIGIQSLTRGIKKMFPLYRPKGGMRGRAGNAAKAAESRHGSYFKLLVSNRLHLYVCNPEYGIDKKKGKYLKEREMAEEIISQSELLTGLREIHNSFRSVLKGKDPADVDKWIESNDGKVCEDMQRFVNSVKKDIGPIKNAITHDISNGLIEGLNNKIKAIKRSMYGRASDELLWIKLHQTCHAKLH